MRNIGEKVPRAVQAFENRTEAGQRLAEFLTVEKDNWAVLAIPRGGVLVAAPVAKTFNAPLELAFCRKLPIPASPEAGFGAVALDGSVILNDRMVRRAGLRSDEIERIKKNVLKEVRRRAQVYPMGNSFDAEDKNLLLVDDGLATGYTMIAAAQMARGMRPRSLTLAVPASPSDSLDRVEPYFDDVYCMFRQTELPFAVAAYYREFPDLEDEQVAAAIEKAKSAGQKPRGG